MRLELRTLWVLRLAGLAALSLAPLPLRSAETPSADTPGNGSGDKPKQADPSAEKVWSFKLKSVKEDPNDAARVAREAVATFMGDAEFKAKAAELRKKYERWKEEYREDMDRYLNDRIIPVALAATSGKADKLKEGALFLAYYYEFRQPVPSLVSDFVKDNLDSLNRIFGAFTWERGAAYVKAKQWRKDLDEKRKEEAKKTSQEKSGNAEAKTVGEKP